MPLENPYRHGAYFFTLATLIKMGINKTHKFSAFTAKLQQVWTKADADGWKDFKNRKARNEATAKDLEGRIFQNCRVLQRVGDYGKPLLRAGAVIDSPRDNGGNLMIALNTKSKKPQKPGCAPKPSKPEPKPAKPKAKSTRKPTGGKKTSQNRPGKPTEPIQTASATSETPKAATDESTKAN